MTRGTNKAEAPSPCDVNQLVDAVVHARSKGQKVTFLLGAGASCRNDRSTGIPRGVKLMEKFEECILERQADNGLLKDRDLALYNTYKSALAEAHAATLTTATNNWEKVKNKYVGSTFFDLAEQCFPDTKKRNEFFRVLVEKKQHDEGHVTLAELAMEFADVFDLAMTTNFDNMISEAFPALFAPNASQASPPRGSPPRFASVFICDQPVKAGEKVDKNLDDISCGTSTKTSPFGTYMARQICPASAPRSTPGKRYVGDDGGRLRKHLEAQHRICRSELNFYHYPRSGTAVPRELCQPLQIGPKSPYALAIRAMTLA